VYVPWIKLLPNHWPYIMKHHARRHRARRVVIEARERNA
jgi:hypothetical protein